MDIHMDIQSVRLPDGLELQSARALWKGVNGEGICARGITLNVDQATQESK